VLVDGQAVSGCLYFAVWADGKTVTTVEHLDADGALSNVQKAFIACGAFQCGFCTPGFVLMAHQLLKQNPDPSDEDIRHYLSGNLCRCAAYPEIVAAVKQAAKTVRTKAGERNEILGSLVDRKPDDYRAAGARRNNRYRRRPWRSRVSLPAEMGEARCAKDQHSHRRPLRFRLHLADGIFSAQGYLRHARRSARLSCRDIPVRNRPIAADLSARYPQMDR